MLSELLRLYQSSLINPRAPRCTFAETEILNEGWLLRAALWHWRTHPPTASDFAFLPFPTQAIVYSEGQLYSPFPKRSRGDAAGEGHSHADGIVGDFRIDPESKTGVRLCRDARYLAVFEAKMFSGLSKGVTNAPDYDQVSRTAACIVHAMLEAGLSRLDAHLVVLYPEENNQIDPEEHTRQHIKREIAKRVAGYRSQDDPDPAPRFRAQWEELLPYVQVHFLTWETVLAEIADPELDEFYDLCLRFGKQP